MRDNRDPQVIGLLIRKERVGFIGGPVFSGRPAEIADRVLAGEVEIPDHGTPEAEAKLIELAAEINGNLKPVTDAIRDMMAQRFVVDRILAGPTHAMPDPPRLTDDDVPTTFDHPVKTWTDGPVLSVASSCPACGAPRVRKGRWQFCVNDECDRCEEPI